MAASSSRFLNLTLSSSFLRSCRFTSTSLLLTASGRHPVPLLSLRFCSGTAVPVDVAADAAEAAVTAGHPWPEWGQFLDMLRGKGFFEQVVPSSVVSAGEDTYPLKEQNRVKNACLKFARERFDLLSSLPKDDIQAIVECGCPNTNRKPVNSAKRLREYVHFQEKDACGVCKFRESCDRANVIPKAEDEVRTLNVIRILLEYAIDTKSLSGENSVSERVQESARKLLSKLIILSDTTIDPDLPKPVFANQQSSTKLSDKSKGSAAKARGSVEKGRKTTEMMMGDWLCRNCNFLNFARNRICIECKADGPKKIEAATTEMKQGDWICTQCHFMNFARNKICFKCEEPRPKRQLNPGEWECPSCDFVNFTRNRVCKKCNLDRPEDIQHNKFGPRNTRGAGNSRGFDYIDRGSDSDDDAFHMHVASVRPKPDQRRTAAKSRGVVDLEDGLRTSKPRSFQGRRV